MHSETELQEEAIKLVKEAHDFEKNINNGNNLDALVNLLKTKIKSLNYNDNERDYIIMYSFAYAISYFSRRK